MKPIEEIRAAFVDILRGARSRMRGSIVFAALDELEALRRQVARAQELQRGAEAQHCAALARVEELEDARTAWRNDALAFQGEWAEAAEQRDAAEAKLAKAREALLFGANLLSGHRYQWEHEGDEESGQHDEDCRACEYEAMLARFEAALSDEMPAPTALADLFRNIPPLQHGALAFPADEKPEAVTLCGEPWTATDCCILPAGHGGRHRYAASSRPDPAPSVEPSNCKCRSCTDNPLPPIPDTLTRLEAQRYVWDAVEHMAGLARYDLDRAVVQARDEALEDAARVTDAARNNPDNYKRGMDAEDMAGFILDAIRDLKSKKETP